MRISHAIMLGCVALLAAGCSSRVRVPLSLPLSAIPPHPCAGLPDHIYVKTRGHTFNSRHYFSVKDGRICFKANEEVTGIKEPWSLFGPGGLPSNDKGDPEFRRPSMIVEITADADELVARSADNEFYFIRFENRSALSGDFWRDREGVPGGRLHLGQKERRNRGYSLGRRNQDVLYWDDPAGNPHHWGTDGISTIYVLSESGQDINIFDTGLPPDFSRQVCGPERGRFVAESIAASASTIFLISKFGEMYTRLADFDTLGTNPMFFNYTYRPVRRPADRGDDPRTLFTDWALPAEEWKKQPSIPLSGRARISRDITILQNGHGNSARELRVAGLDSDGNTGYYHKPIDGNAWTFRRTQQAIDDSRLLNSNDVEDGQGHRGPSADIHYSGHVRLGRKVRLPAQLSDFNLQCSPARLRFDVSSTPVEITLHALDAWTYATRQDPGRDGTPRNFLGTLSVPASLLNGTDSEAKRTVEKYINKRDLIPNTLVVAASLNYVEFRSRSRRNRIRGEFTRVGAGFASPSDAVQYELKQFDPIANVVNSDYLVIKDLDALTGTAVDMALLRDKIRLNSYTEKRLRSARQASEKAASQQRWLARGFSVANFVARITLISRIPRLHNISAIAGTLLDLQADTSERLVRGSRQDYAAAVKQLQSRIVAYQAKLRVLQSTEREASRE